MKRGPHSRENKTLSARGLLATVREVFTRMPNPRATRKITLGDCLSSALAMFSLKSPSLLAFDNGRAEPIVQHNLKNLFKVENTPSDTYMREQLDEVDPKEIRSCFSSVFSKVQRGKLLERYEFLGGYLCLVDGTQIFTSEKIYCESCCQKHHRDGRVSYHHQILAAAIAKPGLKQVIPLCPEPITKQDGASKNDCERNAFQRFLIDLQKEHPRLKLTMVSDALSANAPHVNSLKSFGHDFIITVKPDGNKSLFEWVEGVTREIKISAAKNQYTFRYVNNVPLNNSKDAPMVNFFQCEAIEISGKKEKKKCFSWVTSHKITDNNVYELMQGGRARWKIENETFNTLKNQGYRFEHNFGHGNKNLHTNFAYLMLLAFLIDQVQEAACGLFQAALEGMESRRALWERMRSFFYIYLIDSWANLFEAMSRRKSFLGAKLAHDTS